MIDLEFIKRELKSPKRIVITSHANPDGDAVGSVLAMYHLLQRNGHIVDVILPNKFPEFYAWMPGNKQILIFDDEKKKCSLIISNAELIFCLDYNSLDRLNNLSGPVKKAKGKKILIDHHLDREDHFDYYISEINTSSTSELVYNFIINIGCKSLINKDIARCIYVGIVTDTGSFSYSCNNQSTYLITAELMKYGVDGEKIHNYIYNTYSENRMRLLGFCLKERLKIIPEFNTAYIYLTKQDLKQFEFEVGDTEGVVNFPLAIKNIRMAALFTEKNAKIKISLRSTGNFSVNDFMRNHFEGGGHKNAAGGNSYESLEDTIQKFESFLPKYKDQLKQQE